jgi:hypothetical protein
LPQTRTSRCVDKLSIRSTMRKRYRTPGYYDAFISESNYPISQPKMIDVVIFEHHSRTLTGRLSVRTETAGRRQRRLSSMTSVGIVLVPASVSAHVASTCQNLFCACDLTTDRDMFISRDVRSRLIAGGDVHAL